MGGSGTQKAKTKRDYSVDTIQQGVAISSLKPRPRSELKKEG